MFRLLFWLLFSLAMGLHAPHAEAAAPAGEIWFTLKTPNFRVHHTKPLEAYARVFGKYLERALPLLEADLRWKAPTPIDIVVMDPSDSANGFAASFPNTHIEVYAVPFDPDSALGHYVNWVDELATHELTHIVANDTARGAYKTLRSIFGSWVKPNGLQPVWLIEGLAVYEETKHSKAGRGRSPLLEALLREAAWENKLDTGDYLSLDRFNDGAPWWPGGNTAYLLGYTIQAHSDFGSAGTATPGHLSEANARRIPFMPDSNARAVTGREWQDLWNEAVERLKTRYGTSPPRADHCFLTRSGRFTGGHAVSSDGWVYFSEEDRLQGFHLARVRADSPCDKPVIERLVPRRYEAPTQVSVSPNGNKIAYVETDFDGSDRFLGTLFLYDTKSKDTEELKGADRAHDPSFLDDHTLLYVKNLGGLRQAIVKRDLNTGQDEEIFAAKPFERISGLHYAGLAYFALHDNAGSEAIHWLDLKTGKVSALPPPPNLKLPRYERNPSFAGESLLFSASYGGGPQELYRYESRTGKRTLLARGGSGFIDRPVLHARDVFAVEYNLRGQDIVRLNENMPIAASVENRDLHAYLTGKAPEEEKAADETPFPEPEPYSAWGTAATSPLPQYWIPEIYAAEDGALLGASTGGNDALGYHSYGGLLQYDTRAKFPVYRVFYANRETTTTFRFDATQTNDYFLSTKTSNRKSVYSIAASVPVGHVTFSFGPAFQERHVFRTRGQSFTLFHNVRYDRTGQKPSALSPNRGGLLNLYLGLVPSSLNESFFVDMRPTIAAYFEGFRPTDSISIGAAAGISTNHLLASNYYLGGGVSTLSPSDFVVRGYPVDALLGQRIATLNFAYTYLIDSPHRGLGTNPFFLRAYGLRFHGDLGSANFVSRYSEKTFLGYQAQSLGRQSLAGTGIDLVGTGSVAYHVPLSVSLGLHYGPQKKFGGDAVLFFGVTVGAYGNIGTNGERDR